MNKFTLFDARLEKFKGMLAENGLVGEFRAEHYPIEIEVKRDASAAQIGMFSDKSKDEMFRETRIVLTFPVGAVGVHFFGKLVIADKTLNKIKSQGKKLHELYLQGFFAEMKEAEEDDEEE